tara:strand:- start:167 stop:1006 length:840 start_codon:yes stop_codon:yes gene_type:complete
MRNSIGFMQGRLSPVVDGKIQEFPWATWREEFDTGSKLGFRLMEWTLDQYRLYENPIMTAVGRSEIRDLIRESGVIVRSLTGDCFMQAPFWKSSGYRQTELKRAFEAVVAGCSEIGVKLVVVPLVDEGSMNTEKEKKILLSFLKSNESFFKESDISIIFESDFAAVDLQDFINEFDPDIFGVNYDTGNSAALGFDPVEEISTYGRHIKNIHIKDRELNGGTVPLGSGSTSFDKIFRTLAKIEYKDNFILQTARAKDDRHADALLRYASEVEKWINDYRI